MKRTRTRDPADVFATTAVTILWALYYFITLVVPIVFAIWLGLSIVEVVVNLDHFVAGIPYESHEFNLFFVLDRLLNR